MSLSANQCRIIFITMRKSDVECKMMSISNQKLSMSRQSAELSRKYTNALNATKLVWNTDADNAQLSYANLMTKGYMLTNNSGQVILSSSDASKYGLSASGGPGDFSAKYPSQQKFLEAMGIDSGTAISVIANKKSSTVLDNTSATTYPKGFQISYKDEDVFEQLEKQQIGSLGHKGVLETVYYPSNSSTSAPFIFTVGQNNDSSTDKNQVNTDLGIIIDQITSTATNAILNVLKTNYGSSYSSELDVAFQAAAAEAAEKTKSFYQDNFTVNGKNYHGDGDNNLNHTRKKCDDANAVYLNQKGDDEYLIDLSQVIKTFLNYFDAACSDISLDGALDGKDVGTVFWEQAKNANGGINAPVNRSSNTSSQVIKTGTAPVVQASSEVSLSNAENLLAIYAKLSASGWVVDNKINDKDYLENQLLAGNMSMAEGFGNKEMGYSWSIMSLGDTDSPLTSVTDEDAIARAEAEYTADKDNLDYKESILDVQMNNLDTERSALEAESESVKKLIDSNVKIFKMFEA